MYMKTLELPDLLAHILNPKNPFRVFFCVREINRTYFEIGHDNPDPWHLLYLPEIGDLDVWIEGEYQRVEVGELLWIQPFVKFQIKGIPQDGKINISVCRFHLDEKDPCRLKEDVAIGGVKPRELLLNDLLPGNRVDEAHEHLRARAIIGHVLGHTFLPRDDTQDEQQVSGGLSTNIKKQCIEYIQSHIHQRILIAEIANHVNLNPDYFARQFKKTFGVSPQTWIKTIRIREAADHLLSGTNNISEIADQFGFNNVYFFSRQFREVMGVSPRNWLKQQSH